MSPTDTTVTRRTIAVSPSEPVLISGYRAWCDAWAQDDEGAGLILASFLGPHTVVQALWAILVAGQPLELADRTILRRQQREDAPKTRFLKQAVRFSEIEQAHLVMVAESATLQVTPGSTGYLLGQDPTRFFAIWNRVLPLPARGPWATFLWAEGLRLECVRPIRSYGCQAWAIEPEVETWSQILQGGIEDNVLR